MILLLLLVLANLLPLGQGLRQTLAVGRRLPPTIWARPEESLPALALVRRVVAALPPWAMQSVLPFRAVAVPLETLTMVARDTLAGQVQAFGSLVSGKVYV
jgi:hypothetical protein